MERRTIEDCGKFEHCACFHSFTRATFEELNEFFRCAAVWINRVLIDFLNIYSLLIEVRYTLLYTPRIAVIDNTRSKIINYSFKCHKKLRVLRNHTFELNEKMEEVYRAVEDPSTFL